MHCAIYFDFLVCPRPPHPVRPSRWWKRALASRLAPTLSLSLAYLARQNCVRAFRNCLTAHNTCVPKKNCILICVFSSTLPIPNPPLCLCDRLHSKASKRSWIHFGRATNNTRQFAKKGSETHKYPLPSPPPPYEHLHTHAYTHTQKGHKQCVRARVSLSPVLPGKVCVRFCVRANPIGLHTSYANSDGFVCDSLRCPTNVLTGREGWGGGVEEGGRGSVYIFPRSARPSASLPSPPPLPAPRQPPCCNQRTHAHIHISHNEHSSPSPLAHTPFTLSLPHSAQNTVISLNSFFRFFLFLFETFFLSTSYPPLPLSLSLLRRQKKRYQPTRKALPFAPRFSYFVILLFLFCLFGCISKQFYCPPPPYLFSSCFARSLFPQLPLTQASPPPTHTSSPFFPSVGSGNARTKKGGK